jgi:serine/threonine protein phosphatase PrpC
MESMPDLASNIVTRAIGLDPELSLDVYRDTVQPGDRFLLCSDGLTRVVPEGLITEWMAKDDPQTAVGGLIRATLEAGAPDNVTVLVVEAY